MRYLLLLIACTMLVFAGEARAHPHVFVDMKSAFVIDAEGRLTAVRHVWRFDEPFSAYAVQGLDSDGDGTYDREELTELAKVNVESLEEFDFFTFLEFSDEAVSFAAPTDYWLEHDGQRLTLHFTLPVADGPKLKEAPILADLFDPEFFVAFAPVNDTPFSLEGEGVGLCRLNYTPPPELDASTSAQLYEIPANVRNLPPELFALTSTLSNRVQVACGSVAFLDLDSRPQEMADGVPNPLNSSGDLSALAEADRQVRNVAPFQQVTQWVSSQQIRFFQSLTEAIRNITQDSRFVGWLIVLSFLYGVFHAAGPGHGKAVLASYMLATPVAARRGILLSFLAAGAQAVTAIVAVGVLAVALKATSMRIADSVWMLERISYGIVMLFGIWLVWRKIAVPLLAWLQPAPQPKALGADVPTAHHHDHIHGPDCGCGHSHSVGAELLEGEFRWRDALAIVTSIGLRPCSGAVVVLVFAMGQGLAWAGVASVLAMAVGTAITVSAIVLMAVFGKGLALRISAGEGRGAMLSMRLIEAFGALLVLAFGSVLFVASLGPRPPLF